MSLTIFDQLEQRTDEWYEARRGIVTASTVGTLITASTVKPANNDKSRGLVASLVAERITGIVEPTYQSDDMLRGVLDEPIARDHYAETRKVDVREVGFMRLEDDGFTLGWSPDGLVGDEGGIEIKSPRAKTHIAIVLADEVPAVYMAQVQAALLVSGRDWIDFISWCGGLPMFVKRVTPDAHWFAAITSAAKAFETTAAVMVRDYYKAVEGLPTTERIDYFPRIEV